MGLLGLLTILALPGLFWTFRAILGFRSPSLKNLVPLGAYFGASRHLFWSLPGLQVWGFLGPIFGAWSRVLILGTCLPHIFGGLYFGAFSGLFWSLQNLPAPWGLPGGLFCGPGAYFRTCCALIFFEPYFCTCRGLFWAVPGPSQRTHFGASRAYFGASRGPEVFFGIFGKKKPK